MALRAPAAPIPKTNERELSTKQILVEHLYSNDRQPALHENEAVDLIQETVSFYRLVCVGRNAHRGDATQQTVVSQRASESVHAGVMRVYILQGGTVFRRKNFSAYSHS